MCSSFGDDDSLDGEFIQLDESVDDYTDYDDLADLNIDFIFNDEAEQSEINDIVHDPDKSASAHSLGLEDHYECGHVHNANVFIPSGNKRKKSRDKYSCEFKLIRHKDLSPGKRTIYLQDALSLVTTYMNIFMSLYEVVPKNTIVGVLEYFLGGQTITQHELKTLIRFCFKDFIPILVKDEHRKRAKLVMKIESRRVQILTWMDNPKNFLMVIMTLYKIWIRTKRECQIITLLKSIRKMINIEEE